MNVVLFPFRLIGKLVSFFLDKTVGPQRWQCEAQFGRSGVWLPYEKPFRTEKRAHKFRRFAFELSGSYLRIRDLHEGRA